MARVAVYHMDGKTAQELSLPDDVFGVATNPVLLQQAVVAQMANRRKPLAHTKTRGEVSGGGKKPWRQKGTGRARHGSIRSPLWRGGGVTFGPRNNRNFSLKINQKARRRALCMALSQKVTGKQFIVVDDLKVDQPKTKIIAAMLKALPLGNTFLLVLPGKNAALEKAARNIPHMKTIFANNLNVVDVLGTQSMLVALPAVDTIVKTFTRKTS